MKTVELNVPDCEAFLVAHRALDAGKSVIVRGKEGETVIQQPFEMGLRPRLFIAENLETVEKVLRVYAEARNKVIQSKTEGKSEITPEHPRYQEAVDEINKLALEPQSIELKVIPVSLLNLDKNPIPAAVIHRNMIALDLDN